MESLDEYIDSLLFDKRVTTLTLREQLDEAQVQFDATIESGRVEASIIASKKAVENSERRLWLKHWLSKNI